MIVYACPKCRADMTSPDGTAGGIENCPKCKTAVRVPSLPPMGTAGDGVLRTPEHRELIGILGKISRDLRFIAWVLLIAFLLAFIGTCAMNREGMRRMDEQNRRITGRAY